MIKMTICDCVIFTKQGSQEENRAIITFDFRDLLINQYMRRSINLILKTY